MLRQDAESAAQRVMRLPELVGAIVTLFASGNDYSSLNVAMRVNRLWTAIALPLLWH